MLSRFRFLRWPKISSICVGISITEWIQCNETDFSVPTWSQLPHAKDHHFERTDNNATFFETNYEKLIAEYTNKLEDQNQREILLYSQQIIDSISGAFGLKNQIVVDLGVGTGVFVEPFAKAIGDHGCYIGLDISPSFLYYANERYKSKKNVKLHLSDDDSLKLPQKLKGEVDVFFICATYHHLSNANAILMQIYEYLKPGGKLVIVEFKKHDHGHHKHHHDHDHNTELNKALLKEPEPLNLDTEWIKTHIPFTELQAKEEIVSNGFVFDKHILRGHWKDHFIHVYRKPSFH